MIRATLKPYRTGAAALFFSGIAWTFFILSQKQGAIEGNVAWMYGNLATAVFFAVPLSQIVAKLFGRVAGPAKNHLAHVLLNATAYFFSFGIMAVLLFALSEPLLRAFGGHSAN